MSTVLEMIKDAARESTSPLMDEIVCARSEVGITEFADLDSARRLRFLNFPVSAIGCLLSDNFSDPASSSDFLKSPRTWRQNTMLLENQAWDENTLNEFLEPLKDPDTLGPNCSERLKFQAIGGLVISDNYPERVVAARTWLIHTRGDEAQLVNANVSLRNVISGMKKLAIRALNDNCTIAVCPHSAFSRIPLEIEGERLRCVIRLGNDDFYGRTSAGVFPVTLDRSPSDLLLWLRATVNK
jgi:hypothetical protein